jgi:acyl-CoA synthetase (AMP-forming)/AMP-acid ligase II
VTLAKLPFEERTLPALLARNARSAPDDLFLTDERGTLTWAQAWSRARGMAAAFAALGIGHGDPVVLMLDNRREFVEAWFGLATLGAVEVPMNPDLSRDRLRHIVEHSRAGVAVVQAEHAGRLEAVAGELTRLRTVVVVGDARSTRWPGPAFADLDADPDHYSERGVTNADLAAVMYTSGSTGPPKGVSLPHGQHYTNGWQAASVTRMHAGDVMYLCLPLHHNMAQGYGILPALVAGAHVPLVERFDQATFWTEVRECGATVLPFLGALFALLLKQPAGAPSRPDLPNTLRVAYGLPDRCGPARGVRAALRPRADPRLRLDRGDDPGVELRARPRAGRGGPDPRRLRGPCRGRARPAAHAGRGRGDLRPQPRAVQHVPGLPARSRAHGRRVPQPVVPHRGPRQVRRPGQPVVRGQGR